MKLKLLTLLITAFLFNNAKSQNTAVHFDSLNNYIQTSYSGISGGTTPRTIEAWIKTTSNHIPTAGGKQGVIADWRYPNVIRIAPVPLYNSFEDIFNFGKALENAIYKLD